MDGLCWDRNPTFSEDGPPSELDSNPGNVFEERSSSLSSPTALLMASPFRPSEMSMDHMSMSPRRPWEDGNEAYEWLEVIEMKHVGVQSDIYAECDQDSEDDPHHYIFMPESSLIETEMEHLDMLTLTSEQATDRNANEIDLLATISGDSPRIRDVVERTNPALELDLCIRSEPASTMDSPQSVIVSSKTADQSPTVNNMHGCCVSLGSDQWNNLSPKSLGQQTSPHAQEVSPSKLNPQVNHHILEN